MSEMPNPSSPQNVKTLPISVQQANQAWRQVWYQIRSLTPSAVARILLVLTITGLLIWLGSSTWPALAPFLIGAALAYILLPVVNFLDKFLPRFLAVLLTLLGVLAILGFFLASFIPAISTQITYVYLNIPDQGDLEDIVNNLDSQLATLPAPIENTFKTILAEGVDSAQVKLDESIRGLVNLGLAGVVTLLNTIGFVLGFLVIPAWLLDVLKDHHTGVENIDKQLPAWLRLDFWAVVRLIDRPFRAFVQGQLVLAIAAGIGIYLSLEVLEFLGWEEFRHKVLIAALVSFFQLIPSLGPIIAAIVLFFLGLIRGPEMAVTAVILHILIQWLVNSFVAPRVERRYIDIHPALLIMVIVVLSELGLIWIMLAAPIAAAFRDLFRYVYGRVSDPPKPAGKLPGTPIPILPRSTLFSPFTPHDAQPRPKPVPIAYRRSRALRSDQQIQQAQTNQEA